MYFCFNDHLFSFPCYQYNLDERIKFLHHFGLYDCRAEEQGSRKAGRSGVDLRSVISRRDEIEEKIERCLQGKLDSFLSRVEKMVEDKGEGEMRERVEALQRNVQAVSQKQEVAELKTKGGEHSLGS